jgi:hypothetical protein
MTRNEFFISSAHYLKDTLVRELGATQNQRRQKVMKEYSYAKGKIVCIWGGSDKYDPSKDPFYKSWVKLHWLKSTAKLSETGYLKLSWLTEKSA